MQNLALAAVAGLAAAASASAVTLFNNGPLATGLTTGSGIAAAPGFVWSEVAARTAEPGVANTVAGFAAVNAGASDFRVADDFTVAPGGWNVNSIRVFAYQTGSVANPFNGARLQIWNGRPGDVGSSVIFGDLTTNRLTATGDTNIHRIFNTTTPPPGTAPGTTRLVRFLDLGTGPGGLNLAAGTYWIDWQTTISAGAAAFAPGVTIPGQGNRPGDNGRQWTGTLWQDLLDAGNPGTGLDLIQDLPFIIDGTPIPTPGAAALFAVAGLAGARRRR